MLEIYHIELDGTELPYGFEEVIPQLQQRPWGYVFDFESSNATFDLNSELEYHIHREEPDQLKFRLNEEMYNESHNKNNFFNKDEVNMTANSDTPSLPNNKTVTLDSLINVNQIDITSTNNKTSSELSQIKTIKPVLVNEVHTPTYSNVTLSSLQDNMQHEKDYAAVSESLQGKLRPSWVATASVSRQEFVKEFLYFVTMNITCSCCKWFYPNDGFLRCEVFIDYNFTKLENECKCCTNFVYTDAVLSCQVSTTVMPLENGERRDALLLEANRSNGLIETPCRIAGCPDQTHRRLILEARPQRPRFPNVVQYMLNRTNINMNSLIDQAQHVRERHLYFNSTV